MFSLAHVTDHDKDSETEINRGHTHEFPPGSGRIVPVVNISEDSVTMDYLLRLVYPFSTPKLRAENTQEAELLENVLSAAIKYEIEYAIEELCSAFLSSTIAHSSCSKPSQAVRLYAIAYRHSLRDVARDAARVCLYGKVKGEYFPELENISASAYFHLLNYQDQVRTGVMHFLRSLDSVPYGVTSVLKCPCPRKCGDRFSKWWETFVEEALEIVRIAPLSEEIYSSSVLSEIITAAEGCSACKISVHGVWHTMEKVLRERIPELASKVYAYLAVIEGQRVSSLTSVSTSIVRG